MIVYAADFLLWICMVFCLIQMGGFIGERRFSQAAAATLFISLSFCFLALIYSFVISDFSLKVVFENSNTIKPLIYKISGTWGNHEGSLLMLTWILSLYGFLYSRTPFQCPRFSGAGHDLPLVPAVYENNFQSVRQNAVCNAEWQRFKSAVARYRPRISSANFVHGVCWLFAGVFNRYRHFA